MNNEKDTIYIVSGFMRTGTSMMMRSLEAGGIEAIKRQSREDMRERYADKDYNPNEGGLYEIETTDYQTKSFPKQFKGKVIKLLNAGTSKMSVCSKKIIFMRRDSEEIRQSYQAFFGNELRIKNEDIDFIIDENIELLRNRKDVDIQVFWYRDVVSNPKKHFEILKNSGWPIDVEKCISVVKTDLCRFKKEELTIGIV